jgi:hypothetical protein
MSIVVNQTDWAVDRDATARAVNSDIKQAFAEADKVKTTE